MSKKTLVIGASPNVERYANKAVKLLLEKGHEVQLFGNRKAEIYGRPIQNDWEQLELSNLDTITLYLGAKHQTQYFDRIIEAKPQRVVFNPGTENVALYERLEKNKIDYEEACTLVLLNTGVY